MAHFHRFSSRRSVLIQKSIIAELSTATQTLDRCALSTPKVSHSQRGRSGYGYLLSKSRAVTQPEHDGSSRITARWSRNAVARRLGTVFSYHLVWGGFLVGCSRVSFWGVVKKTRTQKPAFLGAFCLFCEAKEAKQNRQHQQHPLPPPQQEQFSWFMEGERGILK
jgi:hypothetical protein